MFYVSSILSYQRQFAACNATEKNVTFGDRLLGYTQTWGSNENEPPNRGPDEDQHVEPALSINIPKLNAAQEKAAVGFLEAPSDSIQIVQG